MSRPQSQYNQVTQQSSEPRLMMRTGFQRLPHVVLRRLDQHGGRPDAMEGKLKALAVGLFGGRVLTNWIFSCCLMLYFSSLISDYDLCLLLAKTSLLFLQ